MQNCGHMSGIHIRQQRPSATVSVLRAGQTQFQLLTRLFDRPNLTYGSGTGSMHPTDHLATLPSGVAGKATLSGEATDPVASDNQRHVRILRFRSLLSIH